MRIVCLLGSPRREGNTAAIAQRVCAPAEQAGAEVQTYVLNQLRYRGCQACMACKTTSETCVIGDDLEGVLADVHRADVLILASPIYFGDVTAQMKGFIDRTYAFLTPDFHTAENKCRLAHGKKIVWVLAQGNADESSFADVFPKYDFFFRWFGFEEAHVIRACGLSAVGDALGRADIMAQADAVGGALA